MLLSRPGVVVDDLLWSSLSCDVVRTCVGVVVCCHVRESCDSQMQADKVDICLLGSCVWKEELWYHDATVSRALEGYFVLVRQGDNDIVVVEVLPQRHRPCWGEVWEIDVGVFK
jgi:hypothetical protein